MFAGTSTYMYSDAFNTSDIMLGYIFVSTTEQEDTNNNAEGTIHINHASIYLF